MPYRTLPWASATSVSFLLMRALASKTASRPTIAIMRSRVTTIISMSVKPLIEERRESAGGTVVRVMSVHVVERIRVLDEPRHPRRPLADAEARAPARRGDRHVDALELVRNAGADVGQRVRS